MPNSDPNTYVQLKHIWIRGEISSYFPLGVKPDKGSEKLQNQMQVSTALWLLS